MQTKTIGLSLGADICWPASFEALIKKLDLALPIKGVETKIATERVLIEPYDLQYKPKYSVVLDRVTHWYPISREWVKKITLMDGVYVLNNPWAIQSMEKHTTYCAMMKLGFPIPQTWMIPPKRPPSDHKDEITTVNRYSKLFSLNQVGEAVGYPSFFKPYDGGGWVGVRQCKNHADLHSAYDDSSSRVNHLQAGVKDWDLFIRGIGVGPQVNVVKYDPSAPLHGRYVVDFNFIDGEGWKKAIQTTRIINAFFNWDFNSCEMLRANDILHPIDFANACPDSQVTSLHYHFPWLVKALLKWSLYCLATERKVRLNQNWQPYLDIADKDISFEEKFDEYDKLARAHFEVEQFEEFCETHLSHLDEVALEFFGSDEFYNIVEQKVTALYPKHEIEEFSKHFFGLVQFWRKTQTPAASAE